MKCHWNHRVSYPVGPASSAQFSFQTQSITDGKRLAA
jgi:hypothetical protein